jgi:cytochrome P450 family 107 subfamily K polypeptide 1
MNELSQNYPIFDKAARANPHLLYRQMRENCAYYRGVDPHTQWTHWFITRYEDCVAALKNPLFIKDFHKIADIIDEKQRSGPSPLPRRDVMRQNLLFLDEPDHTRLRQLIHRGFTPRRIEDLRQRIHEIADDFLDKMEDQAQPDLVRDFAIPLPITVIAELIGIPAEEREQFRAFASDLIFARDEAVVDRALDDFTDYFDAKFEARRRQPQDDLLSILVNVEEAGDTLSRLELLSMMWILIIAGHETTVSLISNGTLALLEHREQFERLCRETRLIPTAIEELLRFDGPLECATIRWASQDMQIEDNLIKRGDVIMISLVSANRDASIFANPDTLDISRTENPHLAFGHGIHYCLGAPLARLEGAIAFEKLFQRYPRLELSCQHHELKWNNSLVLHGLKNLPVRY